MAQLGIIASKPLRAYGNLPFGLRGCKRRLRHVIGSGLVDSEPASQDFSVFDRLNFFGDEAALEYKPQFLRASAHAV